MVQYNVGGNKVKQRLISAAIGIAALIVILYFRGWVLDIAAVLLAAGAINELRKTLLQRRIHIIAILNFLVIAIFLIAIEHNSPECLLITIVFASMAAMIIPIFVEQRTILDAQATIFAMIYPTLGFMSIIALNRMESDVAFIMLIAGLLFTWGCDSGAYFMGYLFGHRLLCPRISPKKTIGGALGGVLITALLGLAYGLIVQNLIYDGVLWYNYLIIALLISVISQLGDLAASAIKRYCGVKDFGNFMPGHGGILDRFDSVVFAMPVVCTYALLLIGR